MTVQVFTVFFNNIFQILQRRWQSHKYRKETIVPKARKAAISQILWRNI